MLIKIRLNDWNDSYWTVKSLYNSQVLVQVTRELNEILDLFEFHTLMEEAVDDDILNF